MPKVLYLVINKLDKAACESSRLVPLRYTKATAKYTGLREMKKDASERYESIFTSETVTADTHVMLKVTFTIDGVDHYMLTARDGNKAGLPILSKIMNGDETDWGKWHFQGELPLDVANGEEKPLIQFEWVAIV
jgi:hypothetical protein